MLIEVRRAALLQRWRCVFPPPYSIDPADRFECVLGL